MFAIITRQNPDGTYDEVGTNNRRVTRDYKTERTLVRYGLPLNVPAGFLSRKAGYEEN